MGVSVVDASALAAVAFAEPDAQAIVARLREDRLAAPALLWFELANVCATKARRHPEQRSALQQAFALASRLPVEVVAVDHVAVVELAGAAGLTAYDAAYLWLARQLGAPLVTLDRALGAAAEGGR